MGGWGKRDAYFDEVIRANEQDLLAYFQRRTVNGADAGDAFGEMLFVAWKRRSKLPSDPVAARMWLFVVARNVLQNQRRSSVRTSEAIQRLADTMRTLVPESSTDDDVLMLRDAIGQLATDDAELVKLIYWDGFRSTEAAEILGLNPSTARSRLARALNELRSAISVPLR
jgi:RNA polymerase sigma-70 factor (ECF subfamily)